MSPRRSSAPSRIRGTRPSQRLLAALAVLLFLSGSAAVLSAATFTDTTAGQVTVSAAEDFSPPTADLAVPALVSGTVPLAVDARDDRTFVTEVVIERRPAGGSWTSVCTITSAPWTCDWNTVGTPDGDVSLRATATDSVGLTGTSSVVTTLVDNTAPTASLTLPSPISGEITVAPVVSDAGSGVASVVVDYRTGTGAWINLCSRSSAPYSCPLITNNLTNGATYTFRVTVVDAAGNQATASAVSTVDNTTASVSITSPAAGAVLRGTVPVSVAAAVSPGTIGSVAVQWRTGSGSWTTICTDPAAPYSCNWDVRSRTTGAHELRAVMTYDGTRTLVSSPVSVVVDNRDLQAVEIRSTPAAPSGRLSQGDTFTFVFSTEVDPTSLATGWAGTSTVIQADAVGLNRPGGQPTGAVMNFGNLGQLEFTQTIARHNKAIENIPVTLTYTNELVGSLGLRRTVVTARVGALPEQPPDTVSTGTLTWTPGTSIHSPDPAPDRRTITGGTVSGPGAL